MLTFDELQEYRARLTPQKSAEEHKREIGGNLQKARKRASLTQEDVGAILEWGGRKVGRIENGETMCSMEDMISLCQLYGCFLSDILPQDFSPCMSMVYRMDPTVLTALQETLGKVVDRITA